jgi:hypothetical protein
MATVKEIQSEIDKLQKELEYTKQQELKSRYSVAQKQLAELLHDKFCNHNHTDGCGWYCDKGDWSEYSRQEYIQKSINILKYFSLTRAKEFIDLL